MPAAPSLVSRMLGATVGNYRLLSVLGEGAMGAVFLAENPEIRRRVAIKMLQPALAQDEYFAGRFLAEARAASAVRHANIVDILDFGRLPDAGGPYIVMEHLEGETLAQRLARAGRLPVNVAVEYACQVASALDSAHAREIVHRDVKPANLFLTGDPRNPGRALVKVLDFGVAKLRADFSAVRTRTGAVVGTPAYLSPEQCRGNRDIDHRSDIYALGAVLYEMLCGAPPFQSDGLGDMMDKQMNVAPEPPGRRRAGIPIGIEAAVLRALAKRREDRFASMADLQAALQFGLDSGAVGPPAPALRLASTLEASSADLGGTLAPAAGSGIRNAPRPRLLPAMLSGLTVVLVLLGLLALTRPGMRGQSRPAPPAAAITVPEPTRTPAAPPAAAPAALPSASPEAPPVPAAMVTIKIDSAPAGARVFDGVTGAPRGTTPLALTTPRGGAPLSLQLKRTGYQPQAVSIPTGGDTTIQVQLVRKARARGPSTAGLENL